MSKELCQFLGMVNQLSNFFADKSKPLCDLLSAKNQQNQGDLQSTTFTDVITAIGYSQVLGLYDLTNKTIVSADTSPYSLGAVLQ